MNTVAQQRFVQNSDFYDNLGKSSAVTEEHEVVAEAYYDSEDEFFHQVREFANSDPALSEKAVNQLMNIDTPSIGVPRGCVSYALYGNCYRGINCKYAQCHNEAIARESRQWMIKKLAQMMNEEADNPRKLLVGDHG